MLPLLFLLFSTIWLADCYVIGGGTQSGGGSYNPGGGGGGSYNNGIGGGVYPGGGGNNNGGVKNNEGGYCTTNFDCQPNLYCTASVNGVKICLSSNNGGGGSGYPSGNGGCQTSSNCQYGSVCVVTNGVGSCQIQTGGYVSPARQDFNDDAFSKNIPEPGKLNSGCERDGDCDPELSCTLYFGEMMCRFPVKPLIPLRCETDAECPSTEYLCVFSTAMQDKICYKYGDVVTDGYVIPIKHKISMELKKSTTTTESPLTSSVEPIGTFAESEAIFEPESAGIMPQPFLSSALQKRADDVEHRAPARNKSQAPFSPVYMKMMDAAYSEELAHQHDGETAKVTKFVVNEEKERKKDVEDRKEEEEEGIANWEPIDPMATVCEFDYHCRMGESCSGRIRFVDRNVTVCRYDMLKKHRQCIYHSDCLSGQRCIPQNKDWATCETDINATLGVIQCIYDYECSGGEKCTLVDGNERKFGCRPSPTSDPRMNQMCTTNAQCPFQQVCRQSGGISMCVDVSIAKNPAMLHERLWRFLRNFIFR